MVPGTTISTSWANSTLGDLSTEVTDSLSRSGKGAMLAPLKLASGSIAAPGLSWDADPDTGLYRPSAGTVAMGADTTQVQTWTAAGTNFKRPANFDVGLVADGGVTANTLTVSGAATMASTLGVTGLASFAAPANFNNGAAALALYPGTTDHSYMAFYADADNPATRSGYFGFPGPCGSGMVIANAMFGGSITLTPTSGEIIAAANKVTVSGATPASTTGFSNQLTPKNIVKAWAHIQTTGGGSTAVTVLDGFNVFSPSVSSSQLTSCTALQKIPCPWPRAS